MCKQPPVVRRGAPAPSLKGFSAVDEDERDIEPVIGG
jgi:hypothetical protein